MMDPERMSVEFFSGWLSDQYHDDDEWREQREELGLRSRESDYIEEHWQEVIDMLPERVWARVAKAMRAVYDPNGVMDDA